MTFYCQTCRMQVPDIASHRSVHHPYETAGERLCQRELRKELRGGVQHYASGQHAATVEQLTGDDPLVLGRLSYVDVMGHVVLVPCVLTDEGWEPSLLIRAGVATFGPGVAPETVGFALSTEMRRVLDDALRQARAAGEVPPDEGSSTGPSEPPRPPESA